LKERDLIINLLLRSGKRISILCYGGRGGGRRHRAGLLDLGYMLKFELQQTRSRGSSDLVTAREWSSVWAHQHLRHHYQAFYLLAIFLDLVKRLSVEADLQDPHESDDQEQEGVFTVLSNAVFHLDERCSRADSNITINLHLVFFLIKLIYHSGIYPDTKSCLECHSSLVKARGELTFLLEQGGFLCPACQTESGNEWGRELWTNLHEIVQVTYQEISNYEQRQIAWPVLEILYRYLSHHHNLRLSSLAKMP
jgi:DNA repair protein RecO